LSGISAFAQEVAEDEQLIQLKKESSIFESIVAEVLRQNFEHPFAVAAEPKAAYLSGYGLTVSFHLRINRGTIRSIYGEMVNPVGKNTRTKSQQLKTVKDSMIEVIGDYGGALKRLSDDERISICAHVEDRNELNAAEKNTIVVISASKRDTDLFSKQEIDLEEFRQRMEILEY
jgi:hypothetical protein